MRKFEVWVKSEYAGYAAHWECSYEDMQHAFVGAYSNLTAALRTGQITPKLVVAPDLIELSVTIKISNLCL